jgi:hypothetical protein
MKLHIVPFKTLLATLAVTAFTVACGGGEQSAVNGELDAEVKAQHNEVVRIHDEVMPKTDLLKKYAAKIRQQFPDSLKDKVESTQKRVVAELDAANTAMDEWMKAYKIPTLQDEKDKALKYLATQRQQVAGVKEKIETALQNAAALVKLDEAEANAPAQDHNGHGH